MKMLAKFTARGISIAILLKIIIEQNKWGGETHWDYLENCSAEEIQENL